MNGPYSGSKTYAYAAGMDKSGQVFCFRFPDQSTRDAFIVRDMDHRRAVTPGFYEACRLLSSGTVTNKRRSLRAVLVPDSLARTLELAPFTDPAADNGAQ